ncbi:hypothetical protein MIH18_12425 [Marinobacter sp. M3C]|jgi:hypothetical protein|uniref:hypothetical protein n=1 Tax=Marinobacter sp. M3C TaxID=2917715 RepID=UPI00200D24F3|nr:hypothetical protein [Marinobacter sp. M3C]UQG58570.1 hypothetical protein MIH18_12425 [Marinobacter sp. M3C]
MDLTWINVVDTAVKIGLGALISAIAAYIALIKSQSYEDKKEARAHFYKRQEEKKIKYVELLAQSQELIQSHLHKSCPPDSDSIKKYLRAFNEVQIISSDAIRVAAYNLISDVQSFACLNKEQQEIELMSKMVASAREKISYFQKVAQDEVTRRYIKT